MMGKKNKSPLKEEALKYYENWFKDNPNRTPPSIASVEKELKTSENSMYRVLDYVAEKLGMRREDLLHSPHYSYEQSTNKKRELKPIEPIDIDRLKKYFEMLSSQQAELRREAHDILERIDAENYEDTLDEKGEK